ncbi:MAG TPA: hypothetical protein VJM15_06900 [Sphingomicrobium sp.]|nr:hypothetical protein [Sphingomicrobium sp.]
MACKELIAALTMIAASSAASAANLQAAPAAGAPAGSETTRYCLRVEPATGSRLETVQCFTREEWAALEVDVDAEWAENGVKVLA